jgi:hypothetical protein
MITLTLGVVVTAYLYRRLSRAEALNASLRAQRNLAYEFLRQAESYSTTLETELMGVRGLFQLAPGERTVAGVRRKIGRMSS